MAQSAASDGLYARVAVRPPADCILRQLSENHTIVQFRPGSPGEYRPQVVVENTPDSSVRLSESAAIEDIVWLGETAICQLRHPEQRQQDTRYGFDFLPIVPFRYRFRDSWIDLHFATTEYTQLRDTVSSLRDRTFDVDLKQVIQSDDHGVSAGVDQPTIAAVDLSSLTARQREVAAVALENGYFSDDGEHTAEIAAELDISKPTLSGHLRAVIRKVFSQLFG